MYNNDKQVYISSELQDSSTIMKFLHYMSPDIVRTIILYLEQENNRLLKIYNKFPKDRTHYKGVEKSGYLDLLWQNDNLLLYVKQVHHANTSELLINGIFEKISIHDSRYNFPLQDNDYHNTSPEILKDYKYIDYGPNIYLMSLSKNICNKYKDNEVFKRV